MAKPTRLEEIWASTGAIVDPGQTKVELGWEAEIPPYQHFNYIMNKTSEMLDHINTNGIPEWDAATTYVPGAIVKHNSIVWSCQSSSNSTGTEPGTDYDVWVLVSYKNEDFDFVVDTENKLQELASGVPTGLTSVLIKKGSWDLGANGWDLASTGTYRVVGEAGALISGAVNGGLITCSSLNQLRSPYTIENLEVSNRGDGTNLAIGFDNITHLRNCSARVYDNSGINGVGFNDCQDLVGCITTFSGSGTGFLNCEDLVNCYVTESGSSYSDKSLVGYYECTNLSNCKVELSRVAQTSKTGFNFCSRVSNCTAEISGSITTRGFYNSNYIVASYAQVTGTTLGNGFDTCNYVYITSSSGSTSNYNSCFGLNTNTAL